MDEQIMEQLPPVRLFSIAPRQAEQMAPLLTAEAVELLQAGQAFALAAVEEGEARGAVCARLDPENEICLELLSLYVAPQYRRRQLGGTLLMELLEACGEELDGTVARVEADFSPEPGLEALLAKAGFQMEPAGDSLCSRVVSVASLADSPLMKRGASVPGGCTLLSLAELPQGQLRRLSQTLERAGVDYITPQRLLSALPGVSFVLLDAELRPAACAIMTGREDRLCLSQFFVAGSKPACAVAVLRAAAGALLEQFPTAYLELPLLASSSARLAERLLGSAGESEPLIHAVLEL